MSQHHTPPIFPAFARDLNAATSREQGHKIIGGLTVSELNGLAQHLGLPKLRRKQEIRDMIVNIRVGRRIDSMALEGIRY